MKECEIVQDLLIGYNDNTLRNASKELVEKHLKECKKCQNLLNEITSDKSEEINNEIDYLKKVNKKINRKNIGIIITSFIVLFVVIFNLGVFINYYQIAGRMEIFLEDEITNEELANIKSTIKLQDEEAEVTYISKEEALENFKSKNESMKDILEGYNSENNIFPASFIINVKINKVNEIKENIMNLEGVKTITSNTEENPYILFLAKIYVLLN